ncbi:methionine--tRNA ligase [Solirubrobacter soli]|uniref:methionine--tRNA ligase n=1 Tax=Solirubrobacter soli TaxID=363832 RepID=UPI0004812226|nr:methionine--tRNA ligase [Solirubrobacter soli]
MRYLITSALPYINGVKHLGNLVGSMLPADAYARFLRLQGQEVLFICATDEHGTPAELAAAAAELDVAEYCRRQHEIQAKLAEQYLLSFDHFGRSSSPQNRELTQHFGRRLDEEGFIEERTTRQIYSLADHRFLPDRYVVGTCPHCGYPRARGDQCENCTRLLEPVDLIEPRSAISGSRDLEVRESRHLFLRQSLLSDDLRDWLEDKQNWPVLARSIGLKWLDEGLADRGITRDLQWGVPVDRPGMEGKVYYVWFDAPIEYIAATQEWADANGKGDEWRSWWYDADDVWYTQFMAKDNVPFHTVGFPCTLMGSREPWKLVDYLKSFNWLTYYGGKFSTSEQIGVFMDDALDELPLDVWRYYLLLNAPESDDTSFTWQGVATAVNKDLADTLGNFINRTLTFVVRRFGDAVPSGGEPGPAEQQLQADLDVAIAEYTSYLGALEFRKACQTLRRIWTMGNAYFDAQKPWETIKSDEAEAALTLRTATNLIALFARLSLPIIPITATEVLGYLNVDQCEHEWPASADLDALSGGHHFAVPPVLFSKITEGQIADWEQRYGGVP